MQSQTASLKRNTQQSIGRVDFSLNDDVSLVIFCVFSGQVREHRFVREILNVQKGLTMSRKAAETQELLKSRSLQLNQIE